MKAPDVIVAPWQLVTIRLRMAKGWRFRWTLGYWLIKAGSHLIAHRVEISVVAARADRVCFIRGVPPEISIEEALELAAWIVAMFDSGDKFQKMVEEIRNT
jgi:hypothetical protein